MAELRRQIHESNLLDGMQKDSWDLVYDRGERRLYVEHSWNHAHGWEPSRSSSDSKRIEVGAFLAGSHDPTAQHELLRILFPSGNTANA